MKLLVGEDDKFNQRLAQGLCATRVEVQTKTFQDGEVCPRILAPETIFDTDYIEDGNVILSLRKSLEENPNSYLMRCLLVQDELYEIMNGDVDAITTIMPYLPYARQDKQFIKGNAFEPVSLHHVLNHLGISASRLITFTSHFQREQGVIEEYACELHNLDGFSAFVPTLGKISNPFFIAPDKGMKAFAEELAGRYQGESDFLEKSRDTTLGEIVFEEKDLCAIKGKKVIIPDDMVSSGGTLVKSVNNLKRFEPAEIYLMFVHGAFTPGAYARLQETGAKLLFTDTIKDNNSNVSIVPYLTKYLEGV